MSERKITAAFLGALKETLTGPEIADAFVRGFERRIATTPKAPAPVNDKALRDAEARVHNITAALDA